MLVPVRVATLVRSSLRTATAPGLVAIIAVTSAVFTATPLVLGSVAERFDVSISTAGLFSAAQLGAFVIGSWSAPRLLQPRTPVFRWAVGFLAVANAVSVIALTFVAFALARGVAGLALGVVTWLAWSQVFGDPEAQGDLSVVGPLSGMVFAPMLGIILQFGDDRWVYAVLAVAAGACLFAPVSFHARSVDRAIPHRPTLQAVLLILALGTLTMGGNAVFIYSGVQLGDKLGLSPALVALCYSLNALAGIPSARWRGPRPAAGLWLIVTGLCAWQFTVADSVPLAIGILVLWGFSFQAGVPGVFSLLAQRSNYPAERAGDAQAVMGLGRAIAPLLGGAVIALGQYQALGVCAALLMGWSGLTALAVERRPPHLAAGGRAAVA